MNLSKLSVAALCGCYLGAAHSAPRESEVMKPIHNFFSAFARRDKDGLLAEVAPNIEVTSLRKGELRRLPIEKLSELIVAYRAGDISEPIYHPVIHIDDNLAVVWTSYRFLFNGKVDHCGTDIITLMKLHDRWLIVGLADNGREDCK